MYFLDLYIRLSLLWAYFCNIFKTYKTKIFINILRILPFWLTEVYWDFFCKDPLKVLIYIPGDIGNPSILYKLRILFYYNLSICEDCVSLDMEGFNIFIPEGKVIFILYMLENKNASNFNCKYKDLLKIDIFQKKYKHEDISNGLFHGTTKYDEWNSIYFDCIDFPN